MICPNCQHPNSDTAKFCENCGFNLKNLPAAPTPTAPPPPAPPPQSEADATLARLQKLVPQEFAERLLKSRTGKIEGERRTVTILFCDVKGSTALGEERDPEEILEIMNGAFDYLIEPVYRYEGTLARLMGDAILAFFGAPIAHEDDPERACLAALAMQERIKQYAVELKKTRGIENFAVRVGINTGLVVVGEVGSDLRVEYTAMGDAINLASRLENAAEPGNIVISENTARLVQHAIALDPIGALTLKGKSEPVQAFCVIGRKATPTSARGIVGLTSPLVGRELELGILQHAVEELHHGHGGIVSIIGEAGLGKSRLIAELRNSLIANRQSSNNGDTSSAIGYLPSAIRWLEGRSLSYETNTPNAPFIDLLSRLFDFKPGDTDLDKYDKIYNRTQEIMVGRADETAPFIATLMGIELIGEPLERVRYMMPPMLRGQIVMNLIGLVGALAAEQPTVMVFEDLHWTDASSLELLSAILPLVSSVPLLILILLRPNKTDPAWQFQETIAAQYSKNYTAIELQPLDDTHARELVGNLLEIEDLPETVRQLILTKADGNPFFVEEVIRSLLDQKLVVRDGQHWRATREISKIAIPDTLAGVITARLDRLDEESKRTAQTAAVVGREFQFDVLANIFDMPQVLEPSLDTLQARELVRRKMGVPSEAYLFKHALTQETAYSTLLKSKRAGLHKRVGETLEQLAPESVNDIARHFTEAGETMRALPYLIASGERAIHAFSINEAIAYYTQAVDIAKKGDNTQLARRAFEGLGNAFAFANQLDAAFKLYEDMADWGKAHNDVPIQVSALNKIAALVGMRQGQFADAEARLKEAEQLAESVKDKQGLAEGYTIRCQICMSQADFNGTIRYMEQSVDIGRELNVKTQMAFGLTHIASAYMTMGDFDSSFRTGQEAMAISLEIGDREHEAEVSIDSFSNYHFAHGDVDKAIEYLDRGVDIALKINSIFNVIFGSYFRGLIAMERGEYDLARKQFEQSRDHGAPLAEMMTMMAVMGLAPLGGIDSAISEKLADAGQESRDKALTMLNMPTGTPAGGTSYPDLGFDALRRGDVAQAKELFSKGLDVPSIFRVMYRPRSLLGMAQVLAAQGNYEEAEKYAGEARELIETRPMKNFLPLLALTEAQIAAGRGDYERALQEYQRAEFYAVEMNFRPSIWQARAGAAKMLDALGHPDQANEKRAQAYAMIDEIARMFSNENERTLFIESARQKVDETH
ncbi:MAG TPA: adenylate/guanylate cyclase domain-containing protein [Anaerolineae bacterium]|nr:adenylate/guanylate cyclase domain-containing protein [Anaerolineae bacterium]